MSWIEAIQRRFHPRGRGGKWTKRLNLGADWASRLDAMMGVKAIAREDRISSILEGHRRDALEALDKAFGGSAPEDVKDALGDSRRVQEILDNYDTYERFDDEQLDAIIEANRAFAITPEQINAELVKAEARNAKYEHQTLASLGRLPDRKPHNMPEHAAKWTNPKHSKAAGYQMNCTRVVLAYEMRRRGYAVTAIPWGQDGDQFYGDDSFWNDGPLLSMTLPSGAPHGRSIDPDNTPSMSWAKVQEVVKGWPEGARGWMSFLLSTDGGHIVNVEKRDGKLAIIEAQFNPGYKDPGAYLAVAKGSTYRLVRVDDLAPTDRTATMVEV